MKYLLDVTLLANSRAYDFTHGPHEQHLKDNGGENSSVSLPPPHYPSPHDGAPTWACH